MPDPITILFAVLDAFPHDQVSKDLTPTLWSLAQEGGWSREGGQSVLAASTYPNHATFVTGTPPSEHQIFTNRAFNSGTLRPAQEVGPQTSTLFEECRGAGRKSLGVFGDQNLVGVCGAAQADEHWPPGGVLPDAAPRGELGYGADRAVVEALDAMDRSEAQFIFVQLDEMDTVRHLRGPFGDAVLEQGRSTDAALGDILERFRDRWKNTLVVVVSDHDQEAVNPGAVDLSAEVSARGLNVQVDHEGTSALVVGELAEAQLLDLPGVEGTSSLASGFHLVWGSPGQQFGVDWGLAAQHGSPRTRNQLAVVGGGHPVARKIARQIEASRPSALGWADRVRSVLSL